ncbi:MAG: CapA family protein [Candidatus Pacebacteria bacterium]|nr:CapA family protein [Candidatus Paceibacterota bacterium]
MAKKSRQKTLLILLIFSGIFISLVYFLAKPKIITVLPLAEIIETQLKPENSIELLFVGDIMLDRGVELKIKEAGNEDYKFPFLRIADELKGADILFGNLEGTISDKGKKVGSENSFRFSSEAIEGLKFSGFDVLSLANNHTLDYTNLALSDTFLRLKDAGIDYVGAGTSTTPAYSPIIKEVKGTRIAFLAYNNNGIPNWSAGENYSGMAIINEDNLEEIKQNIKDAKNQADILVVSIHWGNEYTQTLTEFQTSFARQAIDSGADLIIGHHPHVAQKSEIYKGKYIFYSLGNFVFDQYFSEETMQGEIVKVLIEDKKIKGAVPATIYMNNNYQPGFEKTELLNASLSSEKLEQGDTLLVKVESDQGVFSEFLEKNINFFKTADSKYWIGIFGIGAKEKIGQYDLIIKSGPTEIKKKIEIAKRNFPTTELMVTDELKEQGYNASQIAENVAKENTLFLKAMSSSSKNAYFNSPFIYPLKNIKNVGAYGNIRKSGDVSLQHLGIDLDANLNTPVYAINSGKIVFSQKLTNYGNTIIIDHGLGIFSLYLHLNEFKAKEGDVISQGQIIGLSGSTGYSIAPHLHFGIKVNSVTVDPLRFIETITF